MKLKKIIMENKKAAAWSIQEVGELILALIVVLIVIGFILEHNGIDFFNLLPDLNQSAANNVATVGSAATAPVSQPYVVTYENVNSGMTITDALKNSLIATINFGYYEVNIETFAPSVKDQSRPVIYRTNLSNTEQKTYQLWDYSKQNWDSASETEPKIPTEQYVIIRTLKELYQVFPLIKPVS